jgi:hypothetical protein
MRHCMAEEKLGYWNRCDWPVMAFPFTPSLPMNTGTEWTAPSPFLSLPNSLPKARGEGERNALLSMSPGAPQPSLRSATLVLLTAVLTCAHAAGAPPALRPVVEAEEDIYTYTNADNGSGPMWCHGSTCLVRIGAEVFASGIETLPNLKPLNNCRWTLYQRGKQGWQLQQVDQIGRTREPSPMVGFPDGRLFLSANPTLTAEGTYNGPARPEILQFSARNVKAPFERLLPVWQGNPRFTEHSYRSFAADGPGRELILFQNIDYTHAEWTFRDRKGKWTAQGQLRWPDGAEYPKPEPIRVCYPNVLLKKRAVHFCGVSDIIEPYPEWRAYKKQLTGKEWDYDFRRLFYTWTPDITREKFRPWVEIASRDKTCGWISPGDLWQGPDGSVHILWTERALDERLRAKFFPEVKQSHAVNHAIVREGKVVLRRTLILSEEGKPGENGSSPRFHVTPDNRLFVICYVSGQGADGKAVSENRLVEIHPGGELGSWVKMPFTKPFTAYFTATTRGGSSPSRTLDLLGERQGVPSTISYARVRLW